jgi:hypothetical protein
VRGSPVDPQKTDQRWGCQVLNGLVSPHPLTCMAPVLNSTSPKQYVMKSRLPKLRVWHGGNTVLEERTLRLKRRSVASSNTASGMDHRSLENTHDALLPSASIIMGTLAQRVIRMAMGGL